MPVVTGVLTAAPWLMLAYVAWRQRHYTAAIAVLCAQMVLPVEYGAIATQAAQGTGAAVGGIGAALFFSRARAPLKFLVFGALGASALCLYPNSVFLIGPAGAYVFLTHWRRRKFWMWCVAPAIVGGLLYARALRFYTRHPEYVLHAQWPIDWTWQNFHDATNNLDRHLGDLTPTLFHAGGFLIPGIALVAWLTLLTRRVRPMLASSVLGLGVLASLGISKLHDGGISYTLPYSRAFYSYPFAIMWLTAMWAEAVPALNSSAAKRAGVVAALTMLGLGMWREATLTAEMARVVAVPATAVSIMRTDHVLDDCQRLRTIAEQHGADLVLHTDNRVEAYACGAEWYGQLDNLYPPYDRRTDRMLRERELVRGRILITGAQSGMCHAAREHGLRCEMVEEAPGLALVSGMRESALTVAGWLGIPVRHL